MPTPITPPDRVREMVSTVCDALEGGARSLAEACRIADVPEVSIARFVDNAEKYGLSDDDLGRYARARDLIIQASVDRIRAFGSERLSDDPNAIARARIGLDAEKFLLARIMPKTFGEKVQAEHTGKDGGPIQTEVTSARDVLAGKLAGLVAARSTSGDTGEPE